jgi:monoamine oxidase
MMLSRRSLIAAPFLLKAGHALSQSADYDVAIVGAGAAGLSAARLCQKKGLSFVVLEAQNRIGGRTVTDTSLGAAFDGGATFIHFSEKNPWTKFAEELGVEAKFGSWRSGGYRAFSDGVPISDDVETARRQGRSKLWELMNDIDESNDLSFEALAKNASPEAAVAARSMMRGAVGEEPDRVSVADYGRLYDGSNLVVPSGYGTLVEKFGADIPVKLSTPVTAIDWSKTAYVSLTTPAGVVRAQKVVVTVPISVLQAEKIKFAPRLPDETIRALNGMKMGALSKLAMKFEGDRFGAPTDMHFVETGDNAPQMSFELWPYDRDIVICWFGADYARQINAQGEQAALQHMLDRFVKIVGADARKSFRGGKHFGWSADPWALGSYSYAVPGRARARDELRRPVANRIWFAGEATAGRASMTVGGATLSAETAVETIYARLKAMR